MRIVVLTATYELRVSRKSHLRDHPTPGACCGWGAGGENTAGAEKPFQAQFGRGGIGSKPEPHFLQNFQGDFLGILKNT
jgi:hypothetical protein